MRIIEIPGHISRESSRIATAAVKQALQEIGIEYLVTLPETPYELLLRDLLQDSSLKIVQVCRESEGMSICSGLTYGGKKAALLCSYKGLYNALDSLLGVAVRTESSFLILVSEAGGKTGDGGSDTGARPVLDTGDGLYSAAILKAINIASYEVSNTAEVPLILEAWTQTRHSLKPVAVVLHW